MTLQIYIHILIHTCMYQLDFSCLAFLFFILHVDLQIEASHSNIVVKGIHVGTLLLHCSPNVGLTTILPHTHGNI